jgi:hypothetical protein
LFFSQAIVNIDSTAIDKVSFLILSDLKCKPLAGMLLQDEIGMTSLLTDCYRNVNAVLLLTGKLLILNKQLLT